MGRTLLLDAKPLSNLLSYLAIGRVLDHDQSYFQTTYGRLTDLLSENETRLFSTHAVATEALHFLIDKSDVTSKMKVLSRTPIELRPGMASDLKDYGQASLAEIDFADFTLLRAWDALFQAGVRPNPLTVTTDHPLMLLARGRFQQNAYTIEELESNPELL